MPWFFALLSKSHCTIICQWFVKLFLAASIDWLPQTLYLFNIKINSWEYRICQITAEQHRHINASQCFDFIHIVRYVPAKCNGVFFCVINIKQVAWCCISELCNTTGLYCSNVFYTSKPWIDVHSNARSG